MTIKPPKMILHEAGIDLPEQVTGLINGKVSAPGDDAEILPLCYPATGEQFAWLREDGPLNVDAAVAAARATFQQGYWANMPVTERQGILRKAAGLLLENRNELALLDTLCAGLPIAHLKERQIPRAAENFMIFADYISTLSGETFEHETGCLAVVTRQPAGVGAVLSPWNAPLALASMQIASCIAFGNSCVCKPSEHTPLAVRRMVQLLEEAGVPPGVINVVNGRGPVTGHTLVSHADVDRIMFTGRTLTAHTIMAAAARNLTPAHLQLSSKSPNIVFADANLEQAVDGSLVNAFSNSGQMCVAGSRILVQRKMAGSFIEKFVKRAANIRIGDPLDSNTEVGPLAFEVHMQNVLSYIALARSEGAEILTGGQTIASLAPGYFVQPTVALVSSNRLRVCQEEVFGPFVTIQVFDEPEEAIAIANDSSFGLVAYVWTENLALSLKLQKSLNAGTVWINTPLVRELRAPFGGFKSSGIGRDGLRQCADFFTEEKATIMAREPTLIRKMGHDGSA